VLFYDEPTGALDPATRREVGTLLCQLRETGIAQVVVAHDVELARQAADTVLLMDAGHLKEAPSLADVPALKAPGEPASGRGP
jgi:ABC-type polar amino acid transport system ATPase subunit